MNRPALDLLRSRRLATWWWLPLVPTAWFSLLWRLGAQPLQNWDESRMAVNAAEMLRDGNWLVTHFRGEPDLWNTKPPLLVWLQALSLEAFGHSEWAFRLPTALAAVALTAMVAVFAWRWLGGPLAGLLAGLALLSSKGFIRQHVAQSGDYEALLMLFTTAQMLAAFVWLQTGRARYLLLLGAAVGLAVLTKSAAGLFFLPGIAIEIIRRGRLVALMKQPAAWAAAALAGGIPALWYGVREQAAPGYWNAVWQNELGGRLLNALEMHTGPWYYYMTDFANMDFLPWTPWVLAAAWALARRPTRRPVHRLFTLTAWTGGLFLVIISLARTKLPWYNAPIYPLLALVVGGGLTVLARWVAHGRPVAARYRLSVLLVALAVVPAVAALQWRLVRVYARRYNQPEQTYGRFLRDSAATPGTRFTLLHRGAAPNTRDYNAPLEFYALAHRQQYPRDTVDVCYTARALPPGRVVLVCGATARATLARSYRTRVLYAADSCYTLQVQGPR